MDVFTHFADEHLIGVTLCGLPYFAIILNERPPTCEHCVTEHADEGWNFPLPAVVTA